MKKNTVFISLGANLGNPSKKFEETIKHINKIGTIKKQSHLYKSSSWGFFSKNNFLNQIVILQTYLGAEELLKKLLYLEIILGRKKITPSKKKKYLSRIIDLDILFYNNEIIQKHNITIPHPKIIYRKFILEILNEISPQKIHPQNKKTIKELNQKCKDNSIIIKL